MSDIGPGTPLICIDPRPESPRWALRDGGMYFCEKARPSDTPCVLHAGCTTEVALRGVDYRWFCGGRFRPLNGDDAELRCERDANPYSTGPSKDDADERLFKPIRPPVKVV